ncbi:GntR family transcriptional regulator [Enterovibrio makurazakiensis]|uniref:GntR family transcriptional regulator n=1 Tax=Enterovibrio gelatinilyticus TaxID=2899819 RepID=A0ABT5R2B7_9GAMM|nr:GntR family transcriptional regulator [Enterovibrio sp. ZSDZ42]MDD1793647.1 GntR family transcriptional regulator [Enterovibrio sp. ZSDZ42]
MRKTLTETAYQAVRQMVLSNELEVGSYYLEEALARRIDVSRTPLREACIRLAQEGLIEPVPRRGIYIKPISLDELHEVLEVVAALELYAISYLDIQTLDDKCWDTLKFHLQMLYDARDQKNNTKWVKHEAAFRLSLIRLTGNKTFLLLMQRMMDKSRRVRAMVSKLGVTPWEAVDAYSHLVRAIECGDKETAKRSHEAYLQRSSRELISLLKGITGLIEARPIQ